MTTDYKPMFELLWAERNTLLQMAGQVPFATPTTEGELLAAMQRSPVIAAVVPRRDFERVLKAVTPPPKDHP